MGHPTQVKRKGTGVNDNDILLTVSRATPLLDPINECNEHFIKVTAGVVDVEVTINDGVDWTDSATFPIAVLLQNATDPNTFVTTVSAGQIALLLGHFDGIRLRQNGATAASAHISSNPR
jgi:hypothetical protein